MKSIETIDKGKYGMSENSVIIYIGGRPTKFQNRDYWNAIKEISRNKNVYFFIGGCELYQIPFFNEIFGEDELERIIFTGWETNYLRFIQSSDIVIDTFPSGAGILLLEAMMLGKPCVSFENNYIEKYSQTEWNLGEEYLNHSDLIIPRYDFKTFLSIVNKLILDKEYRLSIGHLNQQYAQEKYFSPERMVKKTEEIYKKVIQKLLESKKYEIQPAKTETIERDFRIQQRKKYLQLAQEKQALAQEIDSLRNSIAFRIGRAITWLPRKMLRK
jgi:glycosyltransferase involved in cell wall biosynthesis